jgi:hypothetical protein
MRLVRMVLIWVVVVAASTVGVFLWTFNELAVLRVAPNHLEYKTCKAGGGAYAFDIFAHRWMCWEDWNLIYGEAGVKGL